MSVKMKPDDPCYFMLFDGVETTPSVYSPTCYICNDDEFARMGLPLCRKCPACGGHVAADDTRCDNCGLDEQAFWMAIEELDVLPQSGMFIDEEYKPIEPSQDTLAIARTAFWQHKNNLISS